MNTNIYQFDISKPYFLFSALFNTLFRNKDSDDIIIGAKPISFDKNTNMPNPENFLMTLQSKDPVNGEIRIIEVMRSEAIKVEYIKSLYNSLHSATEDDLVTYFYYLGKLLGEFSFLAGFSRKQEIPHLERQIASTKTYLLMMLDNFPTVAEKYRQAVVDHFSYDPTDTESIKTASVVFDISADLKSYIEKFDMLSEMNDYTYPLPFLVTTSYIALTYTLLGVISQLMLSKSLSMIDGIAQLKMADGNCKKLFNILGLDDLPEENYTKIIALFYTFSELNDFFLPSVTFQRLVKHNMTFNALYGLSKCTKDMFWSDDEDVPRDMMTSVYVNTLNQSFYCLSKFTNTDRWLKPSTLSTLKHDCEVPIIYYDMFSNMMNEVYSSEDIENANKSYYDSLLFFKTGCSECRISLLEVKRYLETINSSTKLEVSPALFYQIGALTALARAVAYKSEIVSTKSVCDNQYAFDTMVLGETLLYYLYQQWFNEEGKVYRFSPRKETDPWIGDSAYALFDKECMAVLIDYAKFALNCSGEKFLAILPELNTNQILKILLETNTSEFNHSLPSYKFFRDNLSSKMRDYIFSLVGKEFEGVKVTTSSEFTMGLIPWALAHINIDIITQLLNKDLSLADFYKGLDANILEPDTGASFIDKCTIDEAGLGDISKAYVYKIINTNAERILNSGELSDTLKFILAYGLSYHYTRLYHHENLRNGVDYDTVYSIDKRFLGKETQELIATEEHIADLFKNINTKSSSKTTKYSGKYGLPL